MTAALNLIVIGTSAGGVSALKRLVRTLPADLNAAVCIVMHIPTDKPSYLDQILKTATPLRVGLATDGGELANGEILVARTDHHFQIDGTRVRLTHEAREHQVRPSIDRLFRTAAASYGRRAIGVVLTGLLDDGTEGLRHIKAGGGTTIVQLPSEAEFDSMPESALRHVPIDYTLRLREMAAILAQLVKRGMPTEPREPSFADAGRKERAPYRCLP